MFKTIPFTNGLYSVSTCGKVRSDLTGKTMNQVLRKKDGYLQIGLIIDGAQKWFKVHRLVLMTFSPREDSDTLLVNHKNWIRTDNRLENLEWSSPKDNSNKRSPSYSLFKYLLEKHGNAVVEKKLLELIT